MKNGINEAVKSCYMESTARGWWTGIDAKDPYIMATKLCLVHSEISEAMEAGRKDLKDTHLPDRLGIEVELADAVIRIFDLAGALDLDLGGAMVEKLEYNRQRADHKVKARKAAGGKKF